MKNNVSTEALTGLDVPYGMVEAFHKAFKHPSTPSPKTLAQDRVRARSSWMLEEIQEFLVSNDVVDQADAMIDLIYFALGTLVEMGVKPQKLFDVVHDANMSKLWPDGKARFNADGKVIKPEGWAAPEDQLKQIIESAA